MYKGLLSDTSKGKKLRGSATECYSMCTMLPMRDLQSCSANFATLSGPCASFRYKSLASFHCRHCGRDIQRDVMVCPDRNCRKGKGDRPYA